MKKIGLYIFLTLISCSARSAGPLYFFSPEENLSMDVKINTSVGNARLFGIFSGIEGKPKVAQYCANNFAQLFEKNLKEDPSNIKKVFEKTFNDLDNDIYDQRKDLYGQGAFAVIAYRDAQKTYIAQIGFCSFICTQNSNFNSSKKTPEEINKSEFKQALGLHLPGLQDVSRRVQPMIIVKLNNDIDLLLLLGSFYTTENGQLVRLLIKVQNAKREWLHKLSDLSLWAYSQFGGSTNSLVEDYNLEYGSQKATIKPIHYNNNMMCLFVTAEDSSFRSFLMNLAPSAKQFLITLGGAIGITYALRYFYNWWHASSK